MTFMENDDEFYAKLIFLNEKQVIYFVYADL